MRQHEESLVLPNDEHNRTLVSNVHPSNWVNPEPAGRYNIVVIGARMMPFEGTQPTFKQSPPIRCFSIKATLAPRLAAMTAVINPAVPAPITTML